MPMKFSHLVFFHFPKIDISFLRLTNKKGCKKEQGQGSCSRCLLLGALFEY